MAARFGALGRPIAPPIAPTHPRCWQAVLGLWEARGLPCAAWWKIQCTWRDEPKNAQKNRKRQKWKGKRKHFRVKGKNCLSLYPISISSTTSSSFSKRQMSSYRPALILFPMMPVLLEVSGGLTTLQMANSGQVLGSQLPPVFNGSLLQHPKLPESLIILL